MGNYGNTMDRWYRRGAVVIWPTRLDFEVRAEASPQWALDTLGALIQDGELTHARESAESLILFVVNLRPSGNEFGLMGSRPDLSSTLAVADGLDDAELAAMLLAPFRLEEFTSAHAAPLAGLACVKEKTGRARCWPELQRLATIAPMRPTPNPAAAPPSPRRRRRASADRGQQTAQHIGGIGARECKEPAGGRSAVKAGPQQLSLISAIR